MVASILKAFCWAAAFASALSAAGPASADIYPSRPIRLLVPFPPGGPTDLVARVLAEKMSAVLGQPMVIDNRPGANGNLAAEAAAKAEPDGYTMIYNTSAVAISPALYPNLTYDVVKDLAPVCLTATVPLVLAVNPGLPAKTVQEFVEHVRANPGKLSYGSSSAGAVTHLGAVLFLKSHGLQAVHVPFRGSAPALVAMTGNHVQFMTDTVNTVHPLVTGGQLRALAVMGTKRTPVLPDTPTLAEVGMPDFEIGAWQGILMPVATPKAVIEKVNAAAIAAINDSAVKEKLAVQGAQPLGSTPEAYGEYIRSEIKRWAVVVKESGAKID
jgi:tripartite-type tricarboxylate transporter receptor subunit TctC